MTTSYFHKEECKEDVVGFHFQQAEGELARELQKRKLQEQTRQREADKLNNENDEIKKLRQQIQLAYLNKQRTKQIAEKQIRSIDALSRQAELEVELLKKRDEEERRLRDVELQKVKSRLEGKQLLERQME